MSSAKTYCCTVFPRWNCTDRLAFPIKSNTLRTVVQRRSSSFGNSAISRKISVDVIAGTVSPGETVLVFGATGGVGQIASARLIERGFTVRAATRNPLKAKELFGSAGDKLEVVEADTRTASLSPELWAGVDAVACCTGTTAFPSSRWKGNNGPEQTDFVGIKNVVQSAKEFGNIQRFVLVSSVGVERYSSFPFAILNLFGVLKYKKMGEEVLQASGLPYTILRPGRLTDGPYTSYDLNTLLKATSGDRKNVEVSVRDELNNEASRIVVAEAVVQALCSGAAEDMVISITSKPGNGPGQDEEAWEKLFLSLK